MTGKLSCNIKCLVLSLLILSGITSPLFSQTKISGIINKYGSVTAIGTDYVVVNDAAQFAQFGAGDTVLLIQMKGVRINAKEDNLFGTSGFSYGQAGMHEFITVSSIDVGNKIVFRNNIVHTTFSLAGDVQIIKVPSYNYALVDASLTCAPWDSTTKTGGVLAAIIGRTLALNANIDITGKGFKGGEPAPGLGYCVIADPIKWNQYAYPYVSPGLLDSSGFKGEGLPILADPDNNNSPPYYPVFPNFAKGYGKNFNGGGGGNGKFSGGGGGSNYGAGGIGGKEINTCTPQYPGGTGGIQIAGTGLDGGLFLGGGGGGSTNQGGTPKAGANGGGIVILICDTLKGNSRSILAEGGTPGTASGNAGSGGGGGGGSIALYLQSYSTNLSTSALTISANGGKGGNNTGIFGEGGGGGGGFINTSNIAIPGNITKTVAGGLVGTRSGASTGTGGAPGKNTTPFVPVLNGFLFNSIRSSVTGDQVDSICSNVTPKPITGTTPVGGTGPYSYKWLKSSNSNGPWSEIAGATLKDYTPTLPEPNTFWVRRRVQDDYNFLADTSKAVMIIVQPAITGNLVGKDTTICYNQNPLSLIPLNSGPSNGNGHYQYQWVQNLDNIWPASVASTGTSTLPSYDPPALTATTYYKRVVTSGRCVDYSSAVTITVLPSITGNTISRPDSVICQGSLFNILGASAPGAGSGSYIYQWQDSTVSGFWLPASGVITNPTHAPDTSKFDVTEQRYFRRVVYSGPHDVCRNNSSRILLTRYHKIRNNIISADNFICSGEIPPPLTGTTPTQGDLTYTYQWQDSTKGVPWNTKGTIITPYSPPSLTDTTWYRRIVNSSVCTNTSNLVVVNVHKTILNNVTKLISGPGPDTTICSGAVPHKIIGTIPTGGTDIPGDYAYQWAFSTDNSIYTDIVTSGTLANYQPGALTVSTWFRRKTISGECISISNSIKVIVLPLISNNIITVAKPAVCYNTVPATISGTSLTGGAGGTPIWIWEQSTDGTNWAAASGTGNGQNYSPPALTVKTWYRRIIISGPANCCVDTSNVVTIDINPLPTGIITSVTDTTICNGKDVLLKVHLTGASPWKLVYNENSTTVTVNSIASADYIISRTPSATAGMSTFNYSIVSVEDQNTCLATSLSGTRKADVYRVPVANAGPDDEVCGPEYKLAAVPSDGTGTWYFPPQVLFPLPVAYNDIVKIDSSFISASVSYKFYWEEKNWLCVNKDSVTITFYNRIDTISAGSGGSIMSFDNIARVKAYPIMPFETGKWSVVTGTGDFENETDTSTYIRNISLGVNTYKWTVTNGKCKLEDIVTFDVFVPVIPQAISPDGDLINDTLKIGGLDLVNQEVDLTILNGAGTQVFSTSTRNGWINWDGKNSKGTDLPQGTYYYLLKVKSIKTGLIVSKSGFIILKRN